MSEPQGAFRLLRPSRYGDEADSSSNQSHFRRGAVIAERFQIVGYLGQGGTADVYLGADYGLERHVAIKVLREPTPQRRQRFEREAQIAASIHHPNVVSVFGTGVHAGQAYVVYELVEGAKPLNEAAHGLGLEDRLGLFEQLLAGVAEAHAQGVTHRDLKPDNILVQAPGRLFVADFGLAHIPESSLTATGQFMGTPSYMAPEQVVGGSTSPATDVWALGLILYELVYDRSWYDPGTPLQTLLVQIVQGRLDRPPGAPPALERLIFKEVLLKEPEARLPNAAEFLARLRSLRQPPEQATAPTSNGLLRSLGLLAVGALLGATLAGLALQGRSLGTGGGAAPSETPLGAVAATSAAATPSASRPEPLRASPLVPGPVANHPYGTRPYFVHRKRLMNQDTPRILAAAIAGDLAALRIGGNRLALGWKAELDRQRGVEFLKRAAEGGCPDSMADLAQLYRNRDPERSKNWEARAAKLGAPAILVLRAQRDSGLVPPVEALRPAIESGDDEAARHLALYFAFTGRATEAENWVAVAIAKGSTLARGLRARLQLQSRQKSLLGIVADLRVAAEAGDPVAIFELIRLALLGKGVPKDLSEAKRLFKTHLSAGGTRGAHALLSFYVNFGQSNAASVDHKIDPTALETIRASANDYLCGEAALFLLDLQAIATTERDRLRIWEQSKRLFRSSPRSINPQTHVRFGLALKAERGARSQDREEESYRSFLRADSLGSLVGTSNLGACLLRGEGTPQDVERGVKLLKRGAQGGFPRAWFNLGLAHSRPKRYPQLLSYPKAVAAYAEAGKRGIAKGWLERGKILADRKLEEVFQPALAKEAFVKAAVEGKQNTIYAEAAYLLDAAGAHVQARELYELSLEIGDRRGLGDLGQMLLDGKGGKADPTRAVEILLKAMPNRRVCLLLADCYARGRGVDKDPQQAQEWRERADKAEK